MKNKKVILISSILVLLLIVAGVSYSRIKNDKASVVNNGDSKSVFTSVKDALSRNLTLVCDFKDEKEYSVKSYIKNGSIRVSSSAAAGETQSGEILIKDKKMYMWDLKTKQGFVYEIPDAETSSDKDVSMFGAEVDKSEAYLDMLEKYKDSCKVSSIEDSYFVVPSDVEFKDMSKFLDELKAQMPSDSSPKY